MSLKKYRFDTAKVRAGYNPEEHNRAISVPIYQSTAFDFGSIERGYKLFSYEEEGYLYTRVGNPTVAAFEQRVAALDGAKGAVAFASGMAAISSVILNLAAGGGRIAASPRLYGGSYDSFTQVYPDFGIYFDFAANTGRPEDYDAVIAPDTKAIYIESISNPDAIVADIEAIAAIAHKHGIPLVVDNTFATPYLLRPFEYGADIVVYSATKQLSGHGNVIAGLVLEGSDFRWDNGKFPQFEKKLFTLRSESGQNRSVLETFPAFPFSARLRTVFLNYFGAALGPFDAYLAVIGLETLSERVSKQVANAEKLVAFLESRKEVSWVSHASAKNSPSKTLAYKYLPWGAGSVFTFGFKGTQEEIDRFLNAVKVFNVHVNVGDARSLIVNSPRTTHSELTEEEQIASGLRPESIRISAGLEDAEDLIEDLSQAFDTVFRK